MIHTEKNKEGNNSITEEKGSSKSTEHYNQKLNRSAVCSDCGAFYRHGKWSWEKLPSQLPDNILCPACKRIKDDNPAGVIEITGSYFQKNQQLVLNLIQNICTRAMAESPLQRCIKIENKGNSAFITTTGTELAKNIGSTLFNAYNGELKYKRDNDCLWVSWKS